MKSYLSILFAALLMVCPALAQKAVIPPPPKPADEAPSLPATMKFIQEKVSGEGKVIYAGYGHDAANGQDWVGQYSDEVTNFQASAERCHMQYHFRETSNGQPSVDTDAWFDLKDVQNILVMTREQAFKKVDTANGHPTWSSRVDPPTWMVEVVRQVGVNDFIFREEDMSNRVARALQHAVELCGGGEQKEPF